MCKLTHCRCACPHGNFTHFDLCSTAEAGLDHHQDFEPLSPVHKQAPNQVWPEIIWFNRRLRGDSGDVFAKCWRRGGLSHETNLSIHACPECWVHSRLMKGLSGDCMSTGRCNTCDDMTWSGSFFFHIDCLHIWPTLDDSMRDSLPEDDPRRKDVPAHVLSHGAPWWCELDDQFDFDYSRDGWQRHAENLGWERLSTPKGRTQLERNAATQPKMIIGCLDGARRAPPPPMLDFPCEDRGKMNPMAVLAAMYEHEAMEKREQQAVKEAEPQMLREDVSAEMLDAVAAQIVSGETLCFECIADPAPMSSYICGGGPAFEYLVGPAVESSSINAEGNQREVSLENLDAQAPQNEGDGALFSDYLLGPAPDFSFVDADKQDFQYLIGPVLGSSSNDAEESREGASVENMDAQGPQIEGDGALFFDYLLGPTSVSSSVDAEGETVSEEEEDKKSGEKKGKKKEVEENEDTVMTVEEEAAFEARALQNVVNASVAEACGFTEDLADAMDLDDDFVC